MKLAKAIELLQYADTNAMVLGIYDLKDALKLGIEALKRLKFGRNHPSGWELELLPGETKD